MTLPRIPERSRLPVVIGVSLLALLLVAGSVIVLPRLVPSTPVPTTSPTPASPSADPSTPEGAVRAFFDAFARARRTDDPSIVLPWTTGAASSAYRSAEAFLRGQKEVGKASVTTVLRFENVAVSIDGDTSTVAFDFTEGGYDLDLNTGEALESPAVLPMTRVTVELRQVDGKWLVERYRSDQ
jgi:hypothetical protein